MQTNKKINKDISLQGVSSFQQTNINSFLVQCLNKCGFVRPTPIQYHSIVNFNRYPSHSIIAQSKSGTGKTLAFLVPLLNYICQKRQLNNQQNNNQRKQKQTKQQNQHQQTTNQSNKQTKCLIILPTRQLSIQVYQNLKLMINKSNEVKALLQQRQFKNKLKNITSLLTIGGIPIQDDKKTLLVSGANVIIGTVGRIYQLLQCGSINIKNLQFSIFDQGDKLFCNKDDKLQHILRRIKNMLKNKQEIIRFKQLNNLEQKSQIIKQKDQQRQQNKEKINQQINKDQQKDIFRFMVYSATYDEQSIKKITTKLLQILNPTQQNNKYTKNINKITKQEENKITQQIKQENKLLYIQTLTNTSTDQYIQRITQNWRQLNFVIFNSNNNQSKQKDNQNHTYQKKDQKQNTINSKINKNQIQNSQIINLDNIKKYCLPIQNNNKSIITRKCNKLKQILQQVQYKKCLIFVQKKALLQQIYTQIQSYQPSLIHGSLSQSSRIKAMNQANKTKIIISSDLLARGIDLVLDLVILYDAHINQTFWHRIGRTGRFGRVGIVISLDTISQWPLYNRQQINKTLQENSIQQSELKKNELYGEYMTQYGRWQQVNTQKQSILNKNYNFYVQNEENIITKINDEKYQNNKEQTKMRLNKKQQKQIKKIQKKLQKQIKLNKQQEIEQKDKQIINNNQVPCIGHKQNLTIKQSFKDQNQFKSYYSSIFSCKSCHQLINSIYNLTNYSFSIATYFNT